VGSDEVANHLPGGDVESGLPALGPSPVTPSTAGKSRFAGPGFLAWPDAYGLRKHIESNGLVSGFEFLIAAQTK